MLEKGKQGIKGEWTKNGKRLICFFSGTELHGKRIEQDPVGRGRKEQSGVKANACSDFK